MCLLSSSNRSWHPDNRCRHVQKRPGWSKPPCTPRTTPAAPTLLAAAALDNKLYNTYSKAYPFDAPFANPPWRTSSGASAQVLLEAEVCFCRNNLIATILIQSLTPPAKQRLRVALIAIFLACLCMQFCCLCCTYGFDQLAGFIQPCADQF